MNNITRTAHFSWNYVADFKPDDKLIHHIRHEAGRICQMCTSQLRGKHQFLVNLGRTDRKDFQASLTCRHGGFIFCTSDRALNAVDAFEGAAAKLEENLERLHRFDRRRNPQTETLWPEPVERSGPDTPQSPEDILKEMLGDYLLRLQRYVRRRLRSESLVHADWPVATISDGEVVDETVLRISPNHPSVIPWGAFWPWVIEVCEEVIQEFMKELEIRVQSSISLDADLPVTDDWDPGYDVEHPYYIIERMLFPAEEEVEDATPDERAAAPSTIAEYEDFVTYLNQVMADWPNQEKKIVELYCFEGMQSREIASLMMKKESEILSILDEAMPKLRKAMAEALEK